MHSMLNNLGVVQIRLGCLNKGWASWRGFGGKSLLQWVVRRATESQLLDGVIVVAERGQQSDDISSMVPSDVPIFLSDRTDSLGQFADALFHYSAQNVVRICLEQPFIDPVLIDRLINLAAVQSQFDYIGFCNSSGLPAVETNLGSFAELCKARSSNRRSRSELDTRPSKCDSISLYESRTIPGESDSIAEGTRQIRFSPVVDRARRVGRLGRRVRCSR